MAVKKGAIKRRGHDSAVDPRAGMTMLLPIVGDVSVVQLIGLLFGLWLAFVCISGVIGVCLIRCSPWPTFEGAVVAVGCEDDWSKLLRRGRENKKMIIVDCYARWCPPCKVAARVYTHMSLEYDAIFAKVDVDAARDVASLLQVSALPTFMLYGSVDSGSTPERRDSCVGWSESRLRQMIELHGVARIDDSLHELSEENLSEHSKLMTRQRDAADAAA